MHYPFFDEMRTLVGVLKDMIHRHVQLFPQATNQSSQQDSTGWGPLPAFQGGSSSSFSGCTNVAPITILRVAVCMKLGGKGSKIRFRKIRRDWKCRKKSKNITLYCVNING